MSNFFGRCVLVASLAVGTVTLADSKASGKMDIPKDEKALLERLHHTNQREVKLGNMALKKASSPSVKEFAQQMVTDHQQADDKIMAVAKSLKLTLGEPKPMGDMERKAMEKHKAIDATLAMMEGPPFDSAYMANMVGDHDANIFKLQAAIDVFNNGEVGPVLSQTLNRLSMHRDHAYRVLGEVKPQVTGVGGSGMSDSMDSQGTSDSMGATGSAGAVSGSTAKNKMKDAGM